MHKFLFAIAAPIVFPVLAQEYMPFPAARITETQWKSYFEEVNKTHGNSKRDFPSEHLVVFEDHKALMFWAFTKPGHPAHPAWITRRIVEQSGKASTNQIGYFAGEEQPFAKLYNDYLALTESTVKNLHNEKDDQKLLASRELSFKEAQKVVQQSRLKPGYEQYLKEFSQYSNHIKLDERGGCYLLASGQIKLIIVLTDKAVIESAVADVNNEKAQCFKRIYRDVEVKKPPHTPFAIELIIK
jgi:hypothetical protein